MELKKGMYVRIKDKNNNQFIRKIIKLPEDTRYGSIVVDKDIHYARWVSKKKVIKASSNIIGLIQVGDYVNGVEVIGKEFDNFNKEYLQCGVGDYVICTFEVKDIKSIVTKEAFKANEYRMETD